MVAPALPAVAPTRLPLIVDGEAMTFSLDLLPRSGEYLCYIETPTADQAIRARIALAFAGAHGYWDSYDDVTCRYFAVGFYPVGELPPFAV